MRKAQFAAILCLAFFAFVGGCLIIALDGFTTSGKHGHWSIFVPAPQAYVMAAIMFSLSALGVAWALQQAQAARRTCVAAAIAYGCATYAMTQAMTSYFQ